MVNFELPQMKYPEQKGLISIIVPIYNVEIYLKECLDSILAQTFTNWEAILVDDGSPDNAGEIIDDYAKKDSRFIAIHKQNEGTLLARKTGLENSKGEFIANLDSDDTFHSQFLEKMHSKITETNADFVYCKFQVQKESIIFCMTDYKWSADRSENIANMIACQGINWSMNNKLIRRDICAKISFPAVHLTWLEDGVKMLQVAYNSKSAAFVPEKLYIYRNIAGITAKKILNLIPFVRGRFLLKMTLENLFDGGIPENVKHNFYHYVFSDIIYLYYSINKKQRMEFKNDLEPMFPELIKLETKLNLKICLFLAIKGIEFPFKFRERIKKWLKSQ